MNKAENKLPFMVSALLALGAWLACLASAFLIGQHNLVWTGAAFVILAAALAYGAGGKGGAGLFFMRQRPADFWNGFFVEIDSGPGLYFGVGCNSHQLPVFYTENGPRPYGVCQYVGFAVLAVSLSNGWVAFYGNTQRIAFCTGVCSVFCTQ